MAAESMQQVENGTWLSARIPDTSGIGMTQTGPADPSVFPDEDPASLRRILSDFQQTFVTLGDPKTVVLLAGYVPVFLLGLVGNILVILAVYKNKQLRKPRNYYLTNLSIADILVTVICIPATVTGTVYRVWVFGNASCKIVWFLQGVAVTNSVFSLAALALERYAALKHIQWFRKVNTPETCVKILCLLWALSIVFMLPLAAVRRTETVYVTVEGASLSMSFCIEAWPNNIVRVAFSVFNILLVYIVPCIITAFCYIAISRKLYSKVLARAEFHSNYSHPQNVDCTTDGEETVGGAAKSFDDQTLLFHRHIANMMMVLVAAFIVCWMPYTATAASLDVQQNTGIALEILPFTLLLAHVHSAINPLMYWLLSGAFRRSMNGLVMCRRAAATDSDGSLTQRYRQTLKTSLQKNKPQEQPNNVNKPPQEHKLLAVIGEKDGDDKHREMW